MGALYYTRSSGMDMFCTYGIETCVPIALPDESLLVPTQISPLGPDGAYHNPGGGYTYHNTAIISGAWCEESSIAWKIAGVLEGDPERTTRGALEPTIGELSGGRILVVMRGSNDARPHLAGYKWFSISNDQRAAWSTMLPWTYTDGKPFHLPRGRGSFQSFSGCRGFASHSI